jgi:hypothetical protein
MVNTELRGESLSLYAFRHGMHVIVNYLQNDSQET